MRSGWSRYDAIHVNFAGGSATIPQGYRDTTSGAEYLGATLLTLGVPVELPAGDYASTCVRLTRV